MAFFKSNKRAEELYAAGQIFYCELKNFEEAVNWNLMDCIECGSCTYTCPAQINLVHFFKLGKMRVRAAKPST
jgi:Na+-translocating ferredoxin:NAD+ oxidoreductase RnfC subunit